MQLQPYGPRLIPPHGLTSLYSLHILPSNTSHSYSESWVVGAGKSGIVALWKHSGIEEDNTGKKKQQHTQQQQYGDSVDAHLVQGKQAHKEEQEQEQEHEYHQGIESIVSWKAHNGRWISDAHFLPLPIANYHHDPDHDCDHDPMDTTCTSSSITATYPTNSHYNKTPHPPPQSNQPSGLLTAANDGRICLWDLRSLSSQSGTPRLLYSTSTKGLHKSGIFSMDVCPKTQDPNGNTMSSNYDAWICTGSKDKSVALSNLACGDRPLEGGDGDIGNGSDVIHTQLSTLYRSTYHRGIVKCVHMRGRDSTLLASVADDGACVIHDYRMAGARDDGESNRLVSVLEHVHDRPHSVVWHPYPSELFVTAGLDSTIHTWDLRHLSKPILSYTDHMVSLAAPRRPKSIHRPAMYTPYTTTTNITFQKNPSDGTTTLPKSKGYILSGGEGTHAFTMFGLGCSCQHPPIQSMASSSHCNTRAIGRMHLGHDIGCIATRDSRVAVSIATGEVLMLRPASCGCNEKM
mmetsp:Transcript_5771/g.8366  ORF Transcript_5771/g.8366 Transcript_5771/m.8366 type:complete len:517 (+) Transcript_5771:1845-3395(+)